MTASLDPSSGLFQRLIDSGPKVPSFAEGWVGAPGIDWRSPGGTLSGRGLGFLLTFWSEACSGQGTIVRSQQAVRLDYETGRRAEDVCSSEVENLSVCMVGFGP